MSRLSARAISRTPDPMQDESAAELDARRKVFLHVGKHKTGSTSIQRYLEDNIGFLDGKGLTVVSHDVGSGGPGIPLTNCVDIAHCVIRPELETPYRLGSPTVQWATSADQHREATRINQRLAGMAGDALVVSAEAFSFLRTSAERAVLDLVFDGFEISTVVFLRDPSDWMASWKKQTARLFADFGQSGRGSENLFDYASDSWLIDDGAIESFFQPGCRSFSYQAALAKHESVVPVFLEALGLDLPECPPWEGYSA